MRLTRSMTNIYKKDNNHSDVPFISNDTGKRSGSSQDKEVIAPKRLKSQHADGPPTTPLPNNNDTSNEPSSHQVYETTTSSPLLDDHGQLNDDNDHGYHLSSQQPLVEDSGRRDGSLTPLTDSQQRHFSSSPSSNGRRCSPLNPSSPPPLVPPNRSDGVRYMDDNDEDAHYSTFGWPDVDSMHEPPSDQYYTVNDNGSDDDYTFLQDRPIQRSLIQDFLRADDYVPSDPSRSDFDRPTSEMDLFFSAGQTDLASMNFSTKLSIPQQKQEFLALAKPTYITSWPHFLTFDYFDTHNAHDRGDIIPDTTNDSKNDNNNNNNNDDDDDDDDNGDESKKAAIQSISSASYFDTKFSVLQRIGSGEYADVWKVWNIESNEVFAVKKLKIPFQSFSDRWLQLVEVRNMMMVQHSPYCLNLFNAWEQDGYLYLQTDLAVATLDDYIQHQQEPIEESMAWKIIYEMASGLQAIHHAGVVHLDLKPSNIMIDSNGTLKIGDFGTSIRRPFDAYEFKGEGDRHYMAPDLLREEYDTPADVFSLGLVIFELMTKLQLPSTGDSWEMLRLGDFSEYKQVLTNVPLEIRRLMIMMLKPSSGDRATMDDILALPHLQKILASKQQLQPGALYAYAQLIQDEQE